MKNQAYCIPIKMSPFEEAAFSESMNLMEIEPEEACNTMQALREEVEEPNVNQSFDERELSNARLHKSEDKIKPRGRTFEPP